MRYVEYGATVDHTDDVGNTVVCGNDQNTIGDRQNNSGCGGWWRVVEIKQQTKIDLY